MPDVTSLDIIKVNIGYIQAEMSKRKMNNKQEMQTNADRCTNTKTDAISKQDANIQKDQDTPINPVNYFTSSNTDADKRRSIEMTQIIHDKFGDVFNGIGCFKGTFSLQPKPYSRHPLGVYHVLQKPFKEGQKMDIITPLGGRQYSRIVQ